MRHDRDCRLFPHCNCDVDDIRMRLAMLTILLPTAIDLALEHIDRGLEGRVGGAGTDRDVAAATEIERLRDIGELPAAWAAYMEWKSS